MTLEMAIALMNGSKSQEEWDANLESVRNSVNADGSKNPYPLGFVKACIASDMLENLKKTWNNA